MSTSDAAGDSVDRHLAEPEAHRRDGSRFGDVTAKVPDAGVRPLLAGYASSHVDDRARRTPEEFVGDASRQALEAAMRFTGDEEQVGAEDARGGGDCRPRGAGAHVHVHLQAGRSQAPCDRLEVERCAEH